MTKIQLRVLDNYSVKTLKTRSTGVSLKNQSYFFLGKKDLL